MRFRVQGLDHIALCVADQTVSERWYREVLGLQRVYEDEWGDTPVALMAHGSGLALFKTSAGKSAAGLRHIAFRVDRENFETAKEDLERLGIRFAFQDHGASHSIYFRDPDGLELELTTYDL